MKESQAKKERILNSAITLFARKGYSAVGVREIASSADVNIAMISYYFDGKIGILKEIIEKFFNDYLAVFSSAISRNRFILDNIRELIPVLVNFIKSNQELCRVALYELPFDTPEIAELKGEKIKNIRDFIASNLLHDAPFKKNFYDHIPIIAPAVISMIFSNFILGPVIQAAFKLDFDDDFYKKYTKTLTKLLTGGLKGIIEEFSESKAEDK
jgi:AcrR family transcriptional regulator